jgi:hypothetical protein
VGAGGAGQLATLSSGLRLNDVHAAQDGLLADADLVADHLYDRA